MLLNCAECGALIEKKPHEIRKSKSGRAFCNRSCAAKFNNRKYQKRKPAETNNTCVYCGSEFEGSYTRRFCDNTCSANHKAVLFGTMWETGGSDFVNEYSKAARKAGSIEGVARRYLFIVNNFKCSRCGWTYEPSDGGLPPLHASHKDNNFKNNSFDNLELLCPNCHAVDTRESPTKHGSGRRLNGGFW